MPVTQHNPPTLYPPYNNYHHAVEVSSGSRQLFISGLNGYERDGKTMPESFTAQGELVWQHLGEILKSANMTYSNLIFVRVYLASPEYDHENMALRKKFLDHHRVALTVVCSQLLEPQWKIELEAIAAA